MVATVVMTRGSVSRKCPVWTRIFADPRSERPLAGKELVFKSCVLAPPQEGLTNGRTSGIALRRYYLIIKTVGRSRSFFKC